MLPALQAERQLEALEAVSFPHMKSADRRRVLRDRQQALGAAVRAQRATAEDLAAIGIPVTYVKEVAA